MTVFTLSGKDVHYFDIAEAARARGADIATFPYVIRVLWENLGRHQQWGMPVADTEIDAVAHWRTRTGADLPLRVARVILPDSSGLPVLQDLAALRDAVARQGGDPAAVDTQLPVDLIVDHSLQVDHWGSEQARPANLRREFERNAERYRFLKWAQQAFRGLRVFPPGTGIIHQVNLEHIAPVVARTEHDGRQWAYPDFVIGGDSHTPMINALGVLGWGVGGIDAEAALLGHAYTFPMPEVVGVRLSGRIAAPAVTTDAALLVTETLRRAGVAGCMVEFFGPAVAELSVPERATIANMAPEYGATCGFFPVDGVTLAYLADTDRDADQRALIQTYCRANSLLRTEASPQPVYSRIVEIDLGDARPSVAGPRRPQDRMTIGSVAGDFAKRLALPLKEDGFGARTGAQSGALRHGSVVLAAITSCTNTSNPAVMLAAGLVARKAVSRGIQPPAWVKTSLAPGSRVVTNYLGRAGLLAPLQALGFHVIGYGCTTCGGKSGPLTNQAAQAIESGELVAAAVLSGNRNFEGRIHKLVRANYITSPPMVVAYALAGRIDFDPQHEPLAHDAAGIPVYLRELWPAPHEIEALLPLARERATFLQTYAAPGQDDPLWRDMPAPGGLRFPWDPASHYLVEPPFFRTGGGDALERLARRLRGTRVLAAFGDSLTTDHISPGGEIPQDSPAGRYLAEAGISAQDFNTYVARRCNFEVMTRATFANIRVKNLLVPGVEGGITRHFPDGACMSIFEAARAYQNEDTGTIVLAGKEYGTGSSRDWAAKGSALLGVNAVIAESFERIHRANLVGMGILPLAFLPGEGWRQLGLTGEEAYSFDDVAQAVHEGGPVRVTAEGPRGRIVFQAVPQVLTQAERELLAAGGIPVQVLQHFLAGAAESPRGPAPFHS